jgi:chemotaxis protein MotA
MVGPVAARLESLGEEHAQFLQVMRVAICSFSRGASPILAVEYARRSVPVESRPSFIELETTIRKHAKIPIVVKPGETEPLSGNIDNEQPAVSAPVESA